MFKRIFHRSPLAIKKAVTSAKRSGGTVSMQYTAEGNLACTVGGKRPPAVQHLEISNGRYHGYREHSAVQTFVDLKENGLPYSARDEQFFVRGVIDPDIFS